VNTGAVGVLVTLGVVVVLVRMGVDVAGTAGVLGWVPGGFHRFNKVATTSPHPKAVATRWPSPGMKASPP
jgi:hypothetical protein